MSSYKKSTNIQHGAVGVPELCEFNRIELSVPRLKLLRLLDKRTHLSYEETVFLRFLVARAEAADNKIKHVQSIAEKALLKSGSMGT